MIKCVTILSSSSIWWTGSSCFSTSDNSISRSNTWFIHWTRWHTCRARSAHAVRSKFENPKIWKTDVAVSVNICSSNQISFISYCEVTGYIASLQLAVLINAVRSISIYVVVREFFFFPSSSSFSLLDIRSSMSSFVSRWSQQRNIRKPCFQRKIQVPQVY